jgi:cytochrome c oxidase subunit 4
MKAHATPVSHYLIVGFLLLCLTATTVAISFVDLGSWNVVVALTIASVKAVLVLLFFMHLYHDSKIYLLIFLLSVIFLTIFITFTMFDTLRRGEVIKIEAKPFQ